MLLQGPSFRFLEFAKKRHEKKSTEHPEQLNCMYLSCSILLIALLFMCSTAEMKNTSPFHTASHFMAEESREAAETSEVIAVKRRRQSGIWQLYSKSHCRSIPLPCPTQELGTEGQSCWTVYVMVMSHICPEIERKWLWYWEH